VRREEKEEGKSKEEARERERRGGDKHELLSNRLAGVRVSQ
jgi:hypothetical protein